MVRPCTIIGAGVWALSLEAAPRRGIETISPFVDIWFVAYCVLGAFLGLLLWLLGRWFSNRPKYGVRLCPSCLSPRTRQSMARGIERFLPFITHHRCEDCGMRFLRGARPQHAYCPRCGGMDLKIINNAKIRSRIGVAALRLLGYHTYGCSRCWLAFLGTKPLRPPPSQSIRAAAR